MKTVLFLAFFGLAAMTPDCTPDPPEAPEEPCTSVQDANGDGCPEAVCSIDECPPMCNCQIIGNL
jgi:hypothetical protein